MSDEKIRKNGAQHSVRSVIMDICARHQAAKILGIGDGVQSICLDLYKAGHYVTVLDSDRSPLANPTASIPVDELPLPLTNHGLGRIITDSFNMALILQSNNPCYNLSMLIELVFPKIQVGGVIALSIPYHGYLKCLSVLARNWWSRFFSLGYGDYPFQYWSREQLTTFLEQSGFIITECVGVRGASSKWQNLIIVARKS
ncbi:MAG: hypothetical protein P9F19_00500 [Candidatus Contendobacter sp.]|nr:hypothetical protein [Candidatus Contendobacter sp.]MDG4555866.1 hypothetical protein [Candidatus Contendobacter sp.]